MALVFSDSFARYVPGAARMSTRYGNACPIRNSAREKRMIAQMGERANEFLAEIDQNPLDRGLWLVFSDWLEERGHPIAEGLRLLAELKRYPHCTDNDEDDTYWHWLLVNVSELKYSHCRLPCRNPMSHGRKVYRTYEKFTLALLYGAIYLPKHFENVPEDREKSRLLTEDIEPCQNPPPPTVLRSS